jgi:iron complex outermembrane receptor protein
MEGETMRSLKQGLLCASALTVTSLVSGIAYAQDSNEDILETIVVTAQKRSQSLQEIAASITALSGDALADRGIVNTLELETVVPSMVTGVGTRGEATINIRGIGYNEVGSPGVAVHVDGVYQPRPAMGEIAQTDIARVEVLRGPQGTLYGRNANGGVVNYITEQPISEFEGSVRASYANYDEYRITGMINVPLGDNFAARLTVNRFDRNEGFVKNVSVPGNDYDQGDYTGFRLNIAGDLTDKLNVKLIGTTTERNGFIPYFTFINPSVNPALAAGTFPTKPRRIAANTDQEGKRKYSSLAAIVEYDLGDFTIHSTSGYQYFDDYYISDYDMTDINLISADNSQGSKTYTQEVAASGSIGAVDTVIGFFYMDDTFDSTYKFNFPMGFGPIPAGGFLEVNAHSYETKTTAIFADATWNITDRFRLIGGLRYSEDKQTIVQSSTPTGVDDPGCSFLESDLKFTSTTPRAGAQYDISDTSNLYATYSEGAKMGGFNYRAGCNDTFEQEEVTSYEVGLKNSLLDGELVVNLSAFYYDYTNLQTEQVVGLTIDVTNAPAAEVKGLEADVLWRPDAHWTLAGTLSLMDATYKEFSNVNALLPPGPPTDIAGNKLNFAPDVSSNVSVAYHTDPIIAGGALTFRGDLNYRSTVYLREFGLEGDYNDPVTMLGASIKWDSPNEDYSIRLFGTNLTNEAYHPTLTASALLGGAGGPWNKPRQYGIELSAKF